MSCGGVRRDGDCEVHRDVKPESIFILTPSRAVLGDFSLACALGDSERMAQRVPVGQSRRGCPRLHFGDELTSCAAQWGWRK